MTATAVSGQDRITCERCAAPYRPALVDGCPVCGLHAVGYDEEAGEARLLAMVIGSTAVNLLILAALLLAVL